MSTVLLRCVRRQERDEQREMKQVHGGLGKVKAVVQKGCGMCKKMMRPEKRPEACSGRAVVGDGRYLQCFEQ